MSKSLVVGSGAMLGAYGAGVCAELGRQLGRDYFSSFYASSVGVFAATFLAAGQPEVIEGTWRHLVDGTKLIDPFRPWRPLKLNYLESIFQDERAQLDVEAIFNSRVRLSYVLTRLANGQAVYRKPTRQDIFRCMTASSALPVLHGAVTIEGEEFIDGAFSDPLPVAKALRESQLVVVVVNQHEKLGGWGSFQTLGRIYQRAIWSVVPFADNYEAGLRQADEFLNHHRVVVIRPSVPLPLKSGVDTDKARINATIDLGVADARKMAGALKSC